VKGATRFRSHALTEAIILALRRLFGLMLYGAVFPTLSQKKQWVWPLLLMWRVNERHLQATRPNHFNQQKMLNPLFYKLGKKMLLQKQNLLFPYSRVYSHIKKELLQ